jgi:hypothetical protein
MGVPRAPLDIHSDLVERTSRQHEPGPPPAAGAGTHVISPSAPQPTAASEEIEDCDPLPGEPVPKAGEEVSLVNDYGSKVVGIVRNGQTNHLPNPTRVRVLTGQPKKCRWTDLFIMEGVYEVEVLDGKDRGVRAPEPTPPANSGATSGATGGSVHVRGYYRRDGTYVQPHTRSAPRR